MSFLVDLRVLMAYAFEGDPNHLEAEGFFKRVEVEKSEIYVVTSMIFEAEAVWLAGKVDVPLKEWLMFVSDIVASPVLNKIEVDKDVYSNHVRLYKKFGGKLSYFDSFHAAAAIATKYPLVTTDAQLLDTPEIPTKDLKTYM